MRLLQLLPLVSLTACAAQSTGSHPAPSQQTAARALTSMSARLDAASASLGVHAGVAPLTNTASATVQCSLAGSLSVNGTDDVSDTSSSYDLDASFDNCRERDGTLDGSMHWKGYVDATTVRQTAVGDFDFTDDQGQWSCAFDYSLVVDPTGTRYSGTFCGYAINVLVAN